MILQRYPLFTRQEGVTCKDTPHPPHTPLGKMLRRFVACLLPPPPPTKKEEEKKKKVNHGCIEVDFIAIINNSVQAQLRPHDLRSEMLMHHPRQLCVDRVVEIREITPIWDAFGKLHQKGYVAKNCQMCHAAYVSIVRVRESIGRC